MSRKKKKVRPKRKKTPPKAAKRGTAEVVDLGAKRIEKLTENIQNMAHLMAQGLDAEVERIVEVYRTWERASPELSLRPHHKMGMVRLGFVGPGGFERCHEAHRLPESHFISEDDDMIGEIADEIADDRSASEVLMCPAMQSGRCQSIWRAMHTPPCHLLLLEVSHGLGGGAYDDTLMMVVDDFGKSRSGPERFADSFIRAERLLRGPGCGDPVD